MQFETSKDRVKMKANQPDLTTNDDEDSKSINTKENKPKGNVQFSNGIVGGFENESFEGDKDEGVVKGRTHRGTKKDDDRYVK